MEIAEMLERLTSMLRAHEGDLRITSDSPEKFEVTGTREAIQGKKKVDGFYFATVLPKPKDVRFYFFPVYTHVDKIGELGPELKKMLKGKSCFHIKKWDDDIEKELDGLIKKAIDLYKKDDLI
jgi:hypothetical protein